MFSFLENLNDQNHYSKNLNSFNTLLKRGSQAVLFSSMAITSFALHAQEKVNEAQEQQQVSQKPNILFLFSDDHALNAIGAYGNSLCETPNIDRIANQGAVLLNNTCCNSICAPSRAAILTGKQSHQNGLMTNRDRFDGKQQTFPKLLQKEGYKTALIGKWHLKSKPTGFDYWDILPGQGHYYNPDFISEKGTRQVEGYNSDIVANLSLDWLKEQQNSNKDEPFLLMCQFKAPHRNWSPALRHLDLYKDKEFPMPENFFEDYSKRPDYFANNEMKVADHMIAGYDLKLRHVISPDKLGRSRPNYERGRMNSAQRRAWDAAYREENKAFKKAKLEGKELAKWQYQRYIKDYLRCIAGVDENIGEILDYLETSGLAENTIVVYSSDQGFYLGEHGMYDKRWIYQESLSMPFIIRWPGQISSGQRLEAVTQNIDFAPTLLEAAGVVIPSDIQGESFLPLLKGEGSFGREAIYYHYYEKGEHNVPRHEGIYDSRYKLISFYDYDAWELYDLSQDPSEMHSVYDDPEYKEIKEKMHQKLDELKAEYEVN